jgi:hypothetical protein
VQLKGVNVNTNIVLPRLVKKAWEDTCRTFVRPNTGCEKQLQSLLYAKLDDNGLTGLKKEYAFRLIDEKDKEKTNRRIDIAIGEKAFIELECHFISGRATRESMDSIFETHTKPSLERLDQIRKIHPEALCYYAIYSCLPFDMGKYLWQKIRESCDKHKTEFLCVCHEGSLTKCT